MNIATLAKTTGAVLLTATLGGLASRPAKSDWYETLRKPDFQPPRQAFPIVWPLLYADIAAVSAGTVDRLHDEDEQGQARAYSILLALNLVLNGGWTWLFFNRRQLGGRRRGRIDRQQRRSDPACGSDARARRRCHRGDRPRTPAPKMRATGSAGSA
jgi:hypothetical protein